MDTKSIGDYASEKCHGTNTMVSVKDDPRSMSYIIRLWCDFQGKKYVVTRYLSMEAVVAGQTMEWCVKTMIEEMNATLAKEFKSGK